MMRFIRICSASLLLIGSAGSAAAADEVWSLDGFQAPESVLFDAERNVLYVSNVAGAPNEKDGAGFISRVAPDGTMQEAEWVTGFDAPKGLVQSGNTLYVTDIDRLVAINVDSGEISGEWAAEGAQFLNDPAVDESGRVFVSDMLADRIYVLENDALSVFAEGADLQHPNGLHIDGDTLTVAAWGKNIKDDFSTETPGHLLAIDLNSKTVSSVGSGTPVGNLDGLEPDGSGGWLATDWVGGALYRIGADGAATELADLNQGSADLEYIPEEKLAIVPMMMDGKLTAYRIE
jgi:sugar lactone lactonase YvrE